MAQVTFPQAPFPVVAPQSGIAAENRGLSINDLPSAVRAAFPGLKTFNKVQVSVAGTVLQTDDSLVVNAPTGSGKTVILELAIVKLALECAQGQFRAVYLAPTRSLCAEKYHDWRVRFAALGISCIQYDGDNAVEDISKLGQHQLILSTPEKWEVFTRQWGDQIVASVLRPVKLFLIDEIQVMDDGVRGANLELVVSRMKYIDSRMHRERPDESGTPASIRFIAVSACIPNVDDFARWLRNERNVRPFSFAESYRTTTVGRHVVGFPCTSNAYKFELDLNYKLPAIIDEHSRQKPTLIFCSSRKSAETTAHFLARSCMRRSFPPDAILTEMSSKIANKHLQDCVVKGVAYHHAGLLYTDRTCIESHFRSGHLAALCCTSTLCMGVNLPAYLVIVKSTFSFAGKQYADSYILQMIGRAGRAQYNEDGVAVILTAEGNVDHYRKLVTGTAPIESQLHHNLPELLNSEIAHGIIYDQPAVMEWVRSTFFHVRARANPCHYNLAGGRDIEDEIEQLCRDTVDALEQSGLILRRRPNTLLPTVCGKLMARNHLSFQTMKLLQCDMKGTESLQEMLLLVTKAHEFCEYKCRNNEKRILNSLNVPPSGDGPPAQEGKEPPGGIRFRWPGRVTTTGAKVYCLVQAVFGNLPINDHGMYQEAAKIVTLGARISRCIVGLLGANGEQLSAGCFRALVSVTRLIQCFQSKLWENSPFLTKQLSQIGPKLASHLAANGKTSFQAVRESDPREIECILKKQPPFGNDIISFVSSLPQFAIELKKTGSDQEGDTPAFFCTVTQRNVNYDSVLVPVAFTVLVGDSANRLLLHRDNCTVESIPAGEVGYTWPIYLRSALPVEFLSAHLICLDWVGLDCSNTFHLVEPPVATKHKQTTITHFFPNQTAANDTTVSVDTFNFPSAQEMIRCENTSKVNESFGVAKMFKSVSSFIPTTANLSAESVNISLPGLARRSGENVLPSRSLFNRNAPVLETTMENTTSNETFEVSNGFKSIGAITATRLNLSCWNYANMQHVSNNSVMSFVRNPMNVVLPTCHLLNRTAPVQVQGLQMAAPESRFENAFKSKTDAINGITGNAVSALPLNASGVLFPQPPVDQITPIRSILKRVVPTVEDTFHMPQKQVAPAQDHAQTWLNACNYPVGTGCKPEPARRARGNIRPFFASDEFRYIFQHQKCTPSFTICSPSEDILDCFKRYNIFMPPTFEEAIAIDVRKKKKNFDLGPATNVICMDDSE